MKVLSEAYNVNAYKICIHMSTSTTKNIIKQIKLSESSKDYRIINALTSA